MVYDEGEGVGQGRGVAVCMVVGPHPVIVIDRTAFKCGVFQVEDMPAMPGVFGLQGYAVHRLLEDDKVITVKHFKFFLSEHMYTSFQVGFLSGKMDRMFKTVYQCNRWKQIMQ